MAVNTIIGVEEPFSIVDKETEKKVKMCRVYLKRASMDVYGFRTDEVVLRGPSFKQIEDFEDDVSQLVGLNCNVDYSVNQKTGKAKLENFELVLEPVAKK